MITTQPQNPIIHILLFVREFYIKASPDNLIRHFANHIKKLHNLYSFKYRFFLEPNNPIVTYSICLLLFLGTLNLSLSTEWISLTLSKKVLISLSINCECDEPGSLQSSKSLLVGILWNATFGKEWRKLLSSTFSFCFWAPLYLSWVSFSICSKRSSILEASEHCGRSLRLMSISILQQMALYVF